MDINPVNKLGFFERLSSMLLRKPEDREQLMELLHSAYERNLLDADALSITEGALAASEISVSDVMVPRSQMEVIDIDDPQSEIIAQVNRTAHSRFPVIDGDRDNVIGLLLARISCACRPMSNSICVTGCARLYSFPSQATEHAAARISCIAQSHGRGRRRIRECVWPDHH